MDALGEPRVSISEPCSSLNEAHTVRRDSRNAAAVAAAAVVAMSVVAAATEVDRTLRKWTEEPEDLGVLPSCSR